MGNSELRWWPVEAGFEIASDGGELLCRDDDGEPVTPLPPEVSRTRRYPAWALVNRLDEAEAAVGAEEELAAARGMKSHDLMFRIERLAQGLPTAHQPVFYEHTARLLARRGDQTRAGTLFAKARAVEAEHQLPIEDEAWLALHREFAALGALGTKAIADFVKGLKTRAKPDVALETLARVAVLRALAGQAPWPQLPKQLSTFAKAAGRDEVEVHRELLEQMRGAGPALQDSAAAMWTAWRPILVRVCAQSAAVRGLLLELLPQPESLDGWWLELLEECGATAGLVGDADPEARPLGSRAQWLARRIHHPNMNAVMRRRSRVSRQLSTQLSELIVRMAPALRADGEAVQLDGPDYWTQYVDVRVLETCLANGVPVAELKPKAGLDLELWWRNRQPEDDLAAVVADPRFGPIVRQWAAKGDAALLWKVPALRSFLTPPAGIETATHPLDGPKIYGAVHLFGDTVGIETFGPKRPLYSISVLSESLRAGSTNPDAERGVRSLMPLVGRIEWTVLRAVAPATTSDRRELLTAFLEVWAGSVFADPDAANFPGIPEGAPGWGTADRLNRLIALLREHGPVPHDPAAAETLADRAGLSRYAAELALTGVIGVNSYNPPLMATPERKILGLNPKQLEAGRAELSSITDDVRLDLMVGVLPEDPAELWQPGGLVAVAERLALNWTARFGKKPTVSAETVASAPDFGSAMTAQQMCLVLADPTASPLLTHDLDCWLVPGSRGGAAWYDSTPHRVGEFSHWLGAIATAVSWAYSALPAGDPVRVGVPEAVRLLRQRLAHPQLILTAGWPASRTSVDDLAQTFGPTSYTGPVALEDTTFDDGLTITASRDTNHRFYFRSAVYGLDERTAKLHSATGGGYYFGAIQFLTGPVCDAIVERVASGGLAPDAYEADPRASVPEIVAEVADHLGLDTDPAALYLQLLALPQPTDTRVRTWNGWRPAQHKAATAALVARGLVVEEKRPKAGRSAFLPGAWTKAGPGRDSRPVEDWKVDFFKPLGIAPYNEWPRALLPDLFAAARERVLGGDLPA